MSQSNGSKGEGPFAQKKFIEVDGHRMAYIDEGEGAPIVFQHGNPTSSYLWRNVMPACAGLGRLIACDFMGMGDSDKLDPALGPNRYSFNQQRKYLFALWEELKLGSDVVLVLHDVGSMFGFDWANQHRDRVQGIAYMESIVMPLLTTDFPESVREALGKAFKSQAGREASLQSLDFLNGFVLGSRDFTETEQAYYRKPFLVPGEERRPMISFEFPVDGAPEHTAKIVGDYSRWLAESEIPKLMIRADPGYILNGRLYEFARKWPNQTEVTVKGTHYVQESSPDEVGAAVANFVRGLRASTAA
jgi:haloalkane dehalogenase